jgi:GTPase
MAKPLVAIVGRPNVGKSTFFNRLVGRKISIVEDTPGVTRDRIYSDAEWLSYGFTVVDTGGIDPNKEDTILNQMILQAEIAIESADVILFLVDIRDGILPTDLEVAQMMRACKKPIIVVANKSDNISFDEAVYDFYELGFEQIFAISALQGLGIGDLLDSVVDHFNKDDALIEEDSRFKIAVVGKPNAGKSSLVNKILGENRTIVSDIPGTTRDAIDTEFEYQGEKALIIDTAGIRRKSRISAKTIERYSVIRAFTAVRRADVTIILIDADEGLSDQDIKIAGYVHDEGKPCVVVVNKWDLIEKDTHTMNEFEKSIRNKLQFMPYVSIEFISALTGQRINKMLGVAKKAFDNSNRRITTGLLNDCVNEATTVVEPPSKNGRRLKVFYSTQVSVHPPSFVLFVNDPQLMHFSYERYLENFFRKTFDFSGTPIRLMKRNRSEDKGK